MAFTNYPQIILQFQPSSLLILITIIITTYALLFKSKPKIFPPSPPKLPLIGNLHQLWFHLHKLGFLIHHSFHSMSQIYGPLMLLHIGKIPFLIISSPKLAKEIMKNHDKTISNRPNTTIAKTLMYNHVDLFMAPYGEYWRQIRSLYTLQMLSGKRVQALRFIREEEVDLMIENIRKQSKSSSRVNLSEMVGRLSVDIVCRTSFSRKYGDKGFENMFSEFSKLLGLLNVEDCFPWLGWIVNHVNGVHGRVDRVFRECDEFLERVIEDHMKDRGDYVVDEDKIDLVDILLQFEKNNGGSSKQIMKAIVLDMFGAGADTMSTVMEWTIIELLRHPEVMKIAQNEIRSIIGAKQDFKEKNMEKMSYLKAIIKESLRLHPPFPFIARQSTNEINFQGYDIPSKTWIFISVWAMGRDSNVWKDPNEFKPERFFNCSIDFKGHNYELIPFGSGRRQCPGMTLSTTVIELTIAKLLYNFDWEVPEDIQRFTLDITEVSGLPTHKKFLIVANPKQV